MQQSHLIQKLQRFFPDGGRLRLLEKFGGQGDIFQHGILGEQIEILEYQTEMQPVLTDLLIGELTAV